MKKLGTYKKMNCYSCTYGEWLKAFQNGNDDGSNIFIIDGDMVRQNVIIGHYDGNHVIDLYDGKVFRQESKPAVEIKETVSVATGSYVGKRREVAVDVENVDLLELVNQINFADYSVEVDNFFKSL